MAFNNDGGFRIYGEQLNREKHTEPKGTSVVPIDEDLQISMLHKMHSKTKIFGLLIYKDEIKGIRYYDYSKSSFIDIAPWQIHFFNVSGMKVIGVRNIELIKIDSGNNRTHVVEFLTQHEIQQYYRPNRMTSNDLAKALSYIRDYVEDAEYESIINNLR